MLSTAKYTETLPKLNGYGCISEHFALNWYSFTPLAYNKMLLPLYDRLTQKIFLHLVILTEYLSSAVTIVSCNPYITKHKPSITKIYIFYYQHLLMNYFLHQK